MTFWNNLKSTAKKQLLERALTETPTKKPAEDNNYVQMPQGRAEEMPSWAQPNFMKNNNKLLMTNLLQDGQKHLHGDPLDKWLFKKQTNEQTNQGPLGGSVG